MKMKIKKPKMSVSHQKNDGRFSFVMTMTQAIKDLFS